MLDRRSEYSIYVGIIVAFVVLVVFILNLAGAFEVLRYAIPSAMIVISIIAILQIYNSIKEKWSAVRVATLSIIFIYLIATLPLFSLNYGPFGLFLLLIFVMMDIIALILLVNVLTGKMK